MVLTLFLSGCTSEELSEFLEDAGGSNITDAEEPDGQAVGSTVEADKSETDAGAEIDKALETKDIQHVENAVKARPRDPKYLIYRAWFKDLAGDKVGALEDMEKALGLVEESVEGAIEQQRRFYEHGIDALHDILISYPDGSEVRQKLTNFYCMHLPTYKSIFGGTLAGAAYIFFADTELCEIT
jgi:hypothetical protein